MIEKTDGVGGISGPLGAPVGGPPGLPPHWEDQSYFSEPEFDSEFQHQHIHKSKVSSFNLSIMINYSIVKLSRGRKNEEIRCN